MQPERIYFSNTDFRVIGNSGNIGHILEFNSTGELIKNKKYGLGENKLQLFILDEIVYLIENPKSSGGEM